MLLLWLCKPKGQNSLIARASGMTNTDLGRRDMVYVYRNSESIRRHMPIWITQDRSKHLVQISPDTVLAHQFSRNVFTQGRKRFSRQWNPYGLHKKNHEQLWKSAESSFKISFYNTEAYWGMKFRLGKWWMETRNEILFEWNFRFWKKE